MGTDVFETVVQVDLFLRFVGKFYLSTIKQELSLKTGLVYVLGHHYLTECPVGVRLVHCGS